jgi:alginate O-acetyltransferase complex protein AlgJ
MYPEFLPEWMTDAGPAVKTGQFFSHMRTNSTVRVVDLRPALAEAKKRDTIYFLTDSHWNQLGAFHACEEIIRSLQGVIDRTTLLSLDAFELKRTTNPGGNLAQLLLVSDKLMETNCPQLVPRPPLPNLPVVRTDTNKMFLQICENPAATGRVLVFCDSFADGWLPFMGYHFNHVELCRVYLSHDPPAHVWNLSVIEQQRPTIIIDEILDSFLALEDAAAIRKANPLP